MMFKRKGKAISSNTGVSEPSFLNFFARDVWQALSVLSITMK